jgi:hypothetical protein
MAVRIGQGKKYRAEQDKTRNYRAEQDNAGNHCQSWKRQEIIVRAGQGMKSLSEQDKA